MNIYTIDPNKVIVGDRQRKIINAATLRDLSLSIQILGQLQPAICRKNTEGALELVAGERRLRACKMIPKDLEYVLWSELDDPLLIRQIELEENIQREQLTWQERSDAKLQLHELMQQRYGTAIKGHGKGHRVDDTAEMLGESQSLVSADLELAFFAREIPEVAQAKTKTEAKKIVKRLKDGLARHQALREAYGKEVTVDIEAASVHGTENSDMLKKYDQELMNKMLLDYDRRFLLGCFEEVSKELQKESFQIVIFDPPWGVDFDKVMKQTGTTKTYEDSPEKFKEKIFSWLSLTYQLMAQNSHLYFIFGIRNYPLVYETLHKVGFQTNGIPLIWHKQGAHVTRNPEIWPGRCYEAIAFARKGNKKLAQFGRPDIISTPAPTPRLKQEHPSAKHPELFREILRRSAFPGDRVFDPMAGSAMAGVAAQSLYQELALDWYLCECSEEYRNLGIFNLLKGYTAIVADMSSSSLIITDYRQAAPGSPEWLQFWNEHPELQDEMLEWKHRQITQENE